MFSLVNKLSKQPPSLDDEFWYLVSTKWWQLLSEGLSDEEIGPIDNGDLVNSIERIEKGLATAESEGNQFVAVPKRAWDMLHER